MVNALYRLKNMTEFQTLSNTTKMKNKLSTMAPENVSPSPVIWRVILSLTTLSDLRTRAKSQPQDEIPGNKIGH